MADKVIFAICWMGVGMFLLLAILAFFGGLKLEEMQRSGVQQNDEHEFLGQ